ncbi:hypothetical protein D918_08046 [Trichuris suis]|nr:hypothetical protein D918_08046 [Trichuris suis]
MSADRYVAIQYPAIVKNVEKAVQNLGGYEKIATVFNFAITFQADTVSLDHRVIKSLELNPSGGANLFARPTTSRFVTGVYLVVRARRVRRSDGADGASAEDTTFEILSKLPGIHQFFNLFDFQFHPMTGPWARLWCRYGYDPRKNPEACKYQSISVTFARFAFTVLGVPDNSVESEVSWMMPSNLRTGRATVRSSQMSLCIAWLPKRKCSVHTWKLFVLQTHPFRRHVILRYLLLQGLSPCSYGSYDCGQGSCVSDGKAPLCVCPPGITGLHCEIVFTTSCARFTTLSTQCDSRTQVLLSSRTCQAIFHFVVVVDGNGTQHI